MSSTGIGMTRPAHRQPLEPLPNQVRLSQVRPSRRLRRVPNRQARFPQARSGLRSTGIGTTHRNEIVVRSFPAWALGYGPWTTD